MKLKFKASELIHLLFKDFNKVSKRKQNMFNSWEYEIRANLINRKFKVGVRR